MKLAVLLTCFNRKDQTLSCLRTFFKAKDYYNINSEDEEIEAKVYVTDDGCTDGTSDAIKKEFGENVIILKGDGNLYWAGGMRYAWKEALKDHDNVDFYLLLNDDVDLEKDCLNTVLKTHNYCLQTYGKAGVYSGITYSKTPPHVLTYSGCVWINRFLGTMKMLDTADNPQMVDVTNANILLVHKSVVDKIGIFYEKFRHGGADHDYSHQARRNGFPVLVTSEKCGYCDNDHLTELQLKEMLLKMTYKERRKYFDNPVNCIYDYVLGTWRRSPFRAPYVILGRYMALYCPSLYYKLTNIRK